MPVDGALPSLAAALAQGHAVLTAPPGSGKTTHVPLLLRDSAWLDGGSILMLEPRRPAARMAAARMADLLGEDVGETVGYQVRFERRIGPRTRIQVLTEGILTRRLQSDPGLEGVGLLIFDEFHERSLQADLGLALALDLAEALRPDLRILVMSATLEAESVARLLGGAPVIRAEGRLFPVAVQYAEIALRDPLAAMEQAIRTALQEQSGDLLAFLPGTGEIERVRARLTGTLADGIEVLPLHGTLSVAEQQRALVPSAGAGRRVVLATDIAETSVTIEGVTTVVDGGLARKPRFHAGSGLTRLVTEPIPLAAADQRAGRAGRLGPGVCYRLWTRAQEVGRTPHRRAEILDADLAPLALDLALWGLRDPGQLRWLDAPPPPAWLQAVELLKDLGALDPSGTITATGRRLAELPLHPRLGRMLCAAKPGREARRAADLAALLAERDGWIGTPGTGRPADLGLRLHALVAFREGRAVREMERGRLVTADRLSQRLSPDRERVHSRQDAKTPSRTTASAHTPNQPRSHASDADNALNKLGALASWREHSALRYEAPPREPGALLALAYPDRIAQRRGALGSRYLLAGGTGAELPRDDALATHPYLVAAELDARGPDARIQLALPIGESDLRETLAGRIQVSEVLAWDAARECVTARRETRLAALVLDSQAIPTADPQRTLALLLEQVARQFERALPWDAATRQLQARINLLRTADGQGGWPDLSDERLSADLGDWLAPWLQGKRSLAEVRALRLTEVLMGMLDWGQRARLDSLAPETLTTPAGNRRRLDYLAGPEPVLPVPLQELFGTRETPSLCAGRVPIMLHLLSPAGRPVQITRDLAGFWARGYPEVRKELRGRYPKHPWPDDPLTALPVTKTRGHRG
ncbi:ATP-dependent helicase HrpB [uncultured Thiodictyon sp.]|uniref:ATP-dependent helicase HrpB n=1 Tax=uncultured Thiodictyon sp. TaxID=1846217 RepID=UPI0025CF14D7|nr:ATP-dependent helicase HrpB [uncultured Thiodictyon sp.]